MRGLHPQLARRGGLWLVLAAVAAEAAAGMTARAGADEPTGSVLVARVPLPPGTLVRPEHMAYAAVPASLHLPGLLTDPADAAARRTTGAVSAGEPLTAALLGGAPGAGPTPLAPGERAVAVPLSAAGGAGVALGWGARVDVVASTGEGPSGRSEVIVADAEVLAVPTPADADADAVAPGVTGEVLLRVAAGDALRVTAALNFAREVRLLVRPPGESGRVPRAAEAPAP